MGTWALAATGHGTYDRGLLTERGLQHVIACVEAMKTVLGDAVGLALDCGPRWTTPDAIRLARALEPLHVLWLEDLITGDYTPYVNANVYREVTRRTATPIYTGEQVYVRQNFKALIERQAVNIIGPDPCDVGGLAELTWVAAYADLHGLLMAPHGTADGLPPSSRSAPPCRATTSPSSTRSASPPGGTTSSTGCRTPSSRMGSSTCGTAPASA